MDVYDIFKFTFSNIWEVNYTKKEKKIKALKGIVILRRLIYILFTKYVVQMRLRYVEEGDIIILRNVIRYMYFKHYKNIKKFYTL